jgi:hypothetical protein
MATFSSASSRAFSDRVAGRASTTDRAMRFHAAGVLLSQTHATSPCSAVRVGLLFLPITITSFTSAAYCALPSAGGPCGRNCEGESSAHGFM